MEARAAGHIVMKIGDGNWQSIMATTYGSHGRVFDEYMRACLAAAPREPLGVGSVRVVTAMPDMWADLAKFLRDNSHHGTNETADTRRIAKMWSKLALRIERELTKVGNHPAYRHKSILGVDRTVFSAWQNVAHPKRPYSPTIADAIKRSGFDGSFQHGFLVPSTTIIRSRAVTSWRWRPTTDQTATTDPEAPSDPRAEQPQSPLPPSGN